jgi:hypothetical protein
MFVFLQIILVYCLLLCVLWLCVCYLVVHYKYWSCFVKPVSFLISAFDLFLNRRVKIKVKIMYMLKTNVEVFRVFLDRPVNCMLFVLLFCIAFFSICYCIAKCLSKTSLSSHFCLILWCCVLLRLFGRSSKSIIKGYIFDG